MSEVILEGPNRGAARSQLRVTPTRLEVQPGVDQFRSGRGIRPARVIAMDPTGLLRHAGAMHDMSLSNYLKEFAANLDPDARLATLEVNERLELAQQVAHEVFTDRPFTAADCVQIAHLIIERERELRTATE